MIKFSDFVKQNTNLKDLGSWSKLDDLDDLKDLNQIFKSIINDKISINSKNFDLETQKIKSLDKANNIEFFENNII